MSQWEHKMCSYEGGKVELTDKCNSFTITGGVVDGEIGVCLDLDGRFLDKTTVNYLIERLQAALVETKPLAEAYKARQANEPKAPKAEEPEPVKSWADGRELSEEEQEIHNLLNSFPRELLGTIVSLILALGPTATSRDALRMVFKFITAYKIMVVEGSAELQETIRKASTHDVATNIMAIVQVLTERNDTLEQIIEQLKQAAVDRTFVEQERPFVAAD